MSVDSVVHYWTRPINTILWRNVLVEVIVWKTSVSQFMSKIPNQSGTWNRKKLLIKRYNMANEGENWTDFRIKKVQLFYKGKVVDLSEETLWLIPINNLLLNWKSLRSQHKRHKSLKLVNCMNINLLILSETWLSKESFNSKLFFGSSFRVIWRSDRNVGEHDGLLLMLTYLQWLIYLLNVILSL